MKRRFKEAKLIIANNLNGIFYHEFRYLYRCRHSLAEKEKRGRMFL